MSNDAAMDVLMGLAVLVFVFALVSSCVAVAFTLAVQIKVNERKPNWILAIGGVLGGSVLAVLLFVLVAMTGMHVGWPMFYAPPIVAILPWLFLRGRFNELKAALSACIMGAYVGIMFFLTRIQ